MLKFFLITLSAAVAAAAEQAPMVQDGLGQWTLRRDGTASPLNAVVFDGRKFVAVGDHGVVLTSPDGSEWEEQVITQWPLRSVASGNDRLVIASAGRVFVLPENEPPIEHVFDPDLPAPRILTYGNGLFVGILEGLDSGGRWDGTAFVSSDGLEWELRTEPQFMSPFFLALDLFPAEHRFFAVGWQSIWRSTDGLDWKATFPFETVLDVLNGGAYGNGRFVLPGRFRGVAPGDPLNFLLISSDGERWSQHPAPEQDRRFWRMHFGGGLFLAVDVSGAVWSSRDGLAWKLHREAAFSPHPRAMAFGNGTWVAVGGSGVIDFVSTSGAIWQSGPVFQLEAIRAGTESPISLRVEGSGPRSMILEASDDLRHWEEIGPIHPGSGAEILNPEGQPAPPQRFFRALLPSPGAEE